MVAQCKRVIILADFTEDRTVQPHCVLSDSRVDTLITNKKGADGPALLSLRKKLAQVVLV